MGTILVGLRADRALVEECHVNVWTLPGWPAELYMLDVGLRIRNTSKSARSIRSFQLGIPARLKECDATCLVTEIAKTETWQLVFPDCVGITHRSTGYWHHTMARSRLPPFRMTNVRIVAKEEYARDFSVWTIILRKNLPAGRETYVRVRFKIKSVFGGSLAAVNVSKDIGIFERVRTYDLRVNEIREQAGLERIMDLLPRVSAIGRVSAFLIIGPGYTPRVLSPTRHIRLLEAAGWEAYLGRRLRMLGIGGPPKLIIYSWRSPWDAPSNDEFRALASFHRDLGRLDAPTISIATVLALITIGVAQPDWVSAAAEWVWDTPIAAAIGGAIVGVPMLLYFIARFARPVANLLDALLYGIRTS